MLEQMDWGTVPDSDVVPTNLYYLTVVDLGWEYSQNGKLGLKQQLRVEAPELYKGAMLFNRIYIGSDDDPGADQPETWQRRGGQDVKKFLVGVFGEVAQLTGHIPTDVEATRGASVLCFVNHEVDNKTTIKENGVDVPNPYLGMERNRFKKWFPPTDSTALAKVGQMEVPQGARPTSAPPPRPPSVPPLTPAPASPGAVAPPRPPAAPVASAPPAAAAPVRTIPQRPAAPPPPPPPVRPG